jgi:hypothetical protein
MKSSEMPASETTWEKCVQCAKKEKIAAAAGVSRYCGVVWLQLHTAHMGSSVAKTGSIGRSVVHCVQNTMYMVTTGVL